MLKYLSLLLYKIFGWELVGTFPPDLKKAIVVAAPHTSNWDFLWGRAGLYIYGVRVKYLIKNDYFKGPLSFFFKATGGIPVDRSKSNNLVDELTEYMDKQEKMYLLFPPEGTRKKVERWRTGFYHVAVGLKLPIVLGFLDYPSKKAGIGEIFYPSGNFDKDMLFIENFYKDKRGKNPENFNYTIFNRTE
jgi:1-acyl-sn-glycerol-3-phosphate acyltransferase